MVASRVPVFPLRFVYENGEHEEFESVADLAQNLEHFDSERSTECAVTDAEGRAVVLVLDLQEVKVLALKESQ